MYFPKDFFWVLGTLLFAGLNLTFFYARQRNVTPSQKALLALTCFSKNTWIWVISMVKSPFSNTSVPPLVLEMRVCISLWFRYKTSSLLKSQIYLVFESQGVFLLSILCWVLLFSQTSKSPNTSSTQSLTLLSFLKSLPWWPYPVSWL